jgi:hypothetical protein
MQGGHMAASCILYHGPGAKEAALAEAGRIGRLVVPPIGEDGLKVDDARQVAEILLSVPIGEQLGVVVVGPMDEANPKASDTLLKTIEDFPGEYMVPILWANDLGSVSLTIRSRCLERWAATSGVSDDDAIVTAAFQIIDAALAMDYVTLVDTKRPYDKRELELIAAMSEALSTRLDDPACRDLWDHLRAVAGWRNPFLSEIIVAMIGD